MERQDSVSAPAVTLDTTPAAVNAAPAAQPSPIRPRAARMNALLRPVSVELPPKVVNDWKAYKDSSGREYFHSRFLRRSSYTKPECLRDKSDDIGGSNMKSVAPEAGQASSGDPSVKVKVQSPSSSRTVLAQQGDWCWVLEEASQKKYYCNKVSKQSQWTPPDSWVLTGLADTRASKPSASAVAIPVAQPSSAHSRPEFDQQDNSNYSALSASDKISSLDAGAPQQSRSPSQGAVTTSAGGGTLWMDTLEHTGSSRPPVASTIELPHPWKRAWDPATCRTYYVNVDTKETTWTHPSRGGAEPVQVADEWMSSVDPATQRVYFFNRITLQSSWTVPPGLLTTLTQAPNTRFAGRVSRLQLNRPAPLSVREPVLATSSSVVDSDLTNRADYGSHASAVAHTGSPMSPLLKSPIQRTPKADVFHGFADTHVLTKYGGRLEFPSVDMLPPPPRRSAPPKVYRSVLATHGMTAPVCMLTGMHPAVAYALHGTESPHQRIPAAVTQEGYLWKQGGGTSFAGRRSWKRRYFVLQNCMLAYFADSASVVHKPKGACLVYGGQTGLIAGKRGTIRVERLRSSPEQGQGTQAKVASVVDGKHIWRFDLVSHSRVLHLHAERGADYDIWMNALKAAGCTDRRHVSTHSVLSI